MWSSRHDPAILRFAVPALGALAVDPLVSLVDTAFVGRLGTEALGALGVNTGVFGLAFVVFNFLAYGTTPLVADALGRGDRAEAGRTVVQGLCLALGLGVAAVVLLEALAVPIAEAMGAEGALLEPTLTYLRIRALAGPAVLLVTVGHGAFRGFQDTRTPFWLTVVLNAVNLVLDPVLIFGFGWGIAGAAWATVAAQWTGAVLFVYLLLGPRRETFGITLVLPPPREFGRLLGVGSVLSVRTAALVGTLTVTTAIATRFGATTIAAHQVASQVWLFLALVVDAFALAGQALVAEHLGGGRPTEARKVADRLLVWGLGTGVAGTALVFASGPLLPWFFDLEAPVQRELFRVLPIVAVMQPLNALVFVWDGIFMGARRFSFLAASMLVAAAATCAALAAAWAGQWGLLGVWAAMVVLIAVRGAAQGLWYCGPRPIL